MNDRARDAFDVVIGPAILLVFIMGLIGIASC